MAAGAASAAAMSRASWRRSRLASASSSASSGSIACSLRHERAGGEVEGRALGQHVEDHAAGEQRRGPLGLVGVGDHPRAVEDRDRAAAEDPHHRVAVDVLDQAAGVLVDADAEQLRALGHDHQQPAVAVALVEVLVDDGGVDQARGRPRPASSAAWASSRRRRRRPCARTGCSRPPRCRRRRRRARGRAGSRRPPACRTRRDDSLSWLPPVMKMPVASSSALTSAGSWACSRRLRAYGVDLGGTELGEQRVVDLDDLRARARRPSGSRRCGRPCRR